MNRLRQIRTKAIILKKHAQGEHDWKIIFYSPDLGKAEAIAKGARKITSSKNGHLEPLNLCELQLHKSPYRLTITECRVEKNFKITRQDFKRVMLASIMLEIFQKSTYQEEYAAELFELLEKTLEHLEKVKESTLLVIETFKLKLLGKIGVLPDLKSCSSCRNIWKKNQPIWLNGEGHLYCNNCSDQTSHSFHKIGFEVVKLIHYLTHQELKSHHKITMNEEQKNQLSKITGLFLGHHIGREILSEKFLADLSL